MVRLSVTVAVPPAVREVLAALPRPAVPGVRWASPEQWTVKVRPLGHVEDHRVAPLLDALDADLDGMPAVRCELGPATRRRGDWLTVPVHGLDELGETVFAATAGLVPVTHPQPFVADVVLARGRVPRDLAGVPVAAAWTADAVALVADRSAPGRPRFEELGAAPLGR